MDIVELGAMLSGGTPIGALHEALPWYALDEEDAEAAS